MWPAAAALSPGELSRPRVPVVRVALLGLSIARRVHAPDSTERAAFERLAASGLFDIAHLDSLAARAQAVLYVRFALDRASAASQGAVPEAVVTRGAGVKARMLKVLGFYFDADTDVGRDLAEIRKGSGNADLAGDLIALSGLYVTHRARIEKTPEHYVAGDEAEALTIASDVLAALSSDRAGDNPWVERQARVWTLFERSFEEVRAAGLYLFRRDDDVEERYPTLYALNRAGGRRNAKPSTPPAPPSPPDR